jgi:hypothetical protein
MANSASTHCVVSGTLSTHWAEGSAFVSVAGKVLLSVVDGTLSGMVARAAQFRTSYSGKSEVSKTTDRWP